ncbi:MAG: flagellar biosynthesis protein FlhB [Treponema sp.]|nr:flagellar biosynthesis protein FlhB [Treponema sp.]
MIKNDDLLYLNFNLNAPLIIDLQWFSDDDEDAPGKTEMPSEYKLKKLREEGQVAKSQEIVGALGLLLPAMTLLFLAPSMLRTCVEMVRFFFLRVNDLDPVRDGVIVLIFLRYFARLVWPILAVAFIAAIFSNMAQLNGWLFTVKPIVPNFSKIVPKFGQYFRRIFSVEGLFNLGKSLLKIAMIGIVAFILISSDIEKILNLQKSNVYTGLILIAGIAIKMILISSVLLLVFAIADLRFQRWRFEQKHKMTRYEVKEEQKQYMQDPQIQQRIRSRFREMLRQNIAAAVPKADVVITNPTHIAVALQYDMKTMKSPMVVAMGADEMAARIRTIAQAHGIPLVENKPLARSLYEDVEVGEIIPIKYWQTVTLVYAKVWDIIEERRNRKAA